MLAPSRPIARTIRAARGSSWAITRSASLRSVGSGAGLGGQHLGEILDRHLHPPAAGAEGVDHLVAHDGVEPGPDGHVLAPGVALLVDGEQRLLHDVLDHVRREPGAARPGDPAHHRRDRAQERRRRRAGPRGSPPGAAPRATSSSAGPIRSPFAAGTPDCYIPAGMFSPHRVSTKTKAVPREVTARRFGCRMRRGSAGRGPRRRLVCGSTGVAMTAARDTLADRLGRYLARKLDRAVARAEALHPRQRRGAAAGAAAGRRAAGRGQQPGLGGDQVPDPVDLVARGALCRQRAGAGDPGRRAAEPDRGQPRRGLHRRAAVEVRALQHPDLPGERADAAGPGAADRLHGRKASASATT